MAKVKAKPAKKPAKKQPRPRAPAMTQAGVQQPARAPDTAKPRPAALFCCLCGVMLENNGVCRNGACDFFGDVPRCS